MALLDRWLPQFDVRERHSRELSVAPEEALALALACPVTPDPLVWALFRLRGLRFDGTVEEFFTLQSFAVLERTATTLVVGAAGRPWRPRGGLWAFDQAPPGTVRIVVDFFAELHPGGSILSTETRVAAVDQGARRAFRRYWLLIGPFSKLIRRRWLAAAARRATA